MENLYFKDIHILTIRSEIYLILKYFMVLSISFTYNVMSTTFTMFIIFSVYVNTYDDPLTPRKVFVAFSLITLIRTNFYDLSNAVLRVSATVVSVRRIRVIKSYHNFNIIYTFHCRIFLFLMSYSLRRGFLLLILYFVLKVKLY